MLKGTIYLTDDIEVVYQTPTDGTVKIINMDEEKQLPENNPNIIPGTCLLPPIDAKIAEADGNEQIYDAIYSEHLFAPFQQQYISAILAFLYRGGNLLIFLPEAFTNTKDKFIQHMLIRYGIKVGVIGAENPQDYNFFYDLHYIPCWLNMMYKYNLMTPEQYLAQYPTDARLDMDPGIMNKLLDDIKPYADTLQNQINLIIDYHKKLHINPNAIMAIEAI